MTQKKIEKLTAKQEKQLVEWRERWFKIGASTDRSDKPTAQAAITGLYALAGKEPPTFEWVASPKAAIDLIASKLQAEGKSVEDALKQAKEVPRFWGGMECFWQVFYAFARDVLGVKYKDEDSKQLDLWLDISRSTGWWWPFEGLVVCSDRPTEIHWADTTPPRLHNPAGPSVAYSDGWSTYHWRGTAIPAEWITAKDIVDPSLALTWENVEQRRCLAELLGWNKVLQGVNTRVIDQDSDPEIGTLLEADLPGAPKSRFIKVRCGTGRDFVLSVPSTIRTAKEGNAWSYSLTADDLNPEVRT